MSDHVEVLQRMKGWRMPPGESGAINSALDAAIAALAAPAVGGDAAALPVNHEEALQLALMRQTSSNLARCYIDLHAKASPTQQEARKLVTCKCHTERDRQLCRQRKECVVAYATGNQSTPQEAAPACGGVWRCTARWSEWDGGVYTDTKYVKNRDDMLILQDQGYQCTTVTEKP